VDAAAGGLTTRWRAVVLECFSSHPLDVVTCDAESIAETLKTSEMVRMVTVPETSPGGCVVCGLFCCLVRVFRAGPLQNVRLSIRGLCTSQY